MVTVDPKRDTPVLADYVRSFVPDAHALATDDQAALQAVAGPFGVSYEVSTSPTGEVAGRPLQLPVRRRRRRPAGAHVAGGSGPRDHDVGQGPGRRHGAAAARRRRRRRRLTAMTRRSAFVAVAVGVLAALAPAGIACADPAGPTDYGSQITAITPAVPGIDGRDRRRRLVPAPRRRSRASRSSSPATPRSRTCTSTRPASSTENQRSPATYLNASRYGSTVPADADPTLPPDWKIVGTGGAYAWHDHRAHWMSPNPPDGRGPRW